MNLGEKISIFGLVLLAGCSSQPQPVFSQPEVITQTKVIDNSCNWVKIITVSPKDVLTPETARQILTHDRATKTNCPKVLSY